MRLLFACAMMLAAVMPALAENDLPEGVEQLLVCSTTYSLRSDEAREAGDEGAATEFLNMGDAVLWQARASLEAAGYGDQQIEDIEMNIALTAGLNYGFGMGEEMLANCLAAWDSP